MKKRRIIIGDYDTAATGLWTLASWDFSPAVYKSNLVEVPGKDDGDLDLSTVLTGEPIYGSRTLTAVLESSEGTRLERKTRIAEMINRLDGMEKDIVLPDDELQYIRGRVHVEKLYNDPAHCSVQVTAICSPWKYNLNETVVRLLAQTEEKVATLHNQGRRAVVPSVTVADGEVVLGFGASSWALSPGTYKLPEMRLTAGSHEVKYKGAGKISITYREAVLE